MSHPFKQYMVRYAEGEHVYETGERGASMFIVQSGSVRLFRETAEGLSEIGTMEKGDFFGEMAILEGGTRRDTAEVVEASELIEINAATFDAIIQRNLEIAIRMLRKLSHRLRKAEERLASAGPAVASTAAPRPEAVPARPAVNAAPAAPAAPAASAVAAAAAAAAPAPAMIPDSPARLVAEGGEAVYTLESDEALLGRYDPVTEIQPEVDLTELDLKRSVSRRHARITRNDGGYLVVEEVGALNGTFLNGVKLVTGKPTPIRDGDTLALGMVRLVFECESAG